MNTPALRARISLLTRLKSNLKLVRCLHLPSKKIRKLYVDFFVNEHSHTFVPSSSVIPFNDPSLLFVNAGMNQFKSLFLDQVPSGTWLHNLKTAANSQKCIRVGGKHNDLNIVGQDVYHHTFFEMLGNWSFGEYFKKEACSMAWSLLTEVYCIPKEKLYVTYFGGDVGQNLKPDLECKEIWLQLGLPENRVIPFGVKDNFWEMGKCGPCGPCTEIHYDHDPNSATPGYLRVNAGQDDLTEIWNLVFIQYNRVENGELQTLKKQHVDTGMGLERMTAILQNSRSNYDTDLFKPIFSVIQNKGNIKPYSGLVGTDSSAKVDSAYRLVADHSRLIAVSLADGLLPDEVDAGNILRRVIRRALLSSQQYLNCPKGLLGDLATVVSHELGETYPELVRNLKNVKNIVAEEEERFIRIIDNANKVMNQMIANTSGDTLSGQDAWSLFFVHGVSEELIELMVSHRDLKVDWNTFNNLRTEEKEKRQLFTDIDKMNSLKTLLISYLKNLNLAPTVDETKYNYQFADGKYIFQPLDSKVLAIIKGNDLVQEVQVGEKFSMVLDRTNFYSEAGGQDGDKGYAIAGDTVCFIDDTQSLADYVLHLGILEKGVLKVGQNVTLQLKEKHRQGCMRNHTATHLLNKVLKETVPNSVQKSSSVKPSDFRFDFTCKGGLNVDIVTAIEEHINKTIEMSLPVQKTQSTYEEALTDPRLIKLEGESYPELVSVITIRNPEDEQWTSKELCCGTHVFNTSHLENFVIVSQKALSQTIRSIRAMTGSNARMVLAETETTHELTNKLENDMAQLSETNASNYELFDQGLLEVKRIRTILMNVTIALRSKMLIEEQLNALELKINALVRKYHKTTFPDLLNQEWDEIQISQQDQSFNLVVLKSPGSEKMAVKHLNSMIGGTTSKPAMAFFKVDGNKVCCAAWVPKEYSKKMAADGWVNSVTVLQGRQVSKLKDPRHHFYVRGSGQSLQSAVKLAVEYVQIKLK